LNGLGLLFLVSGAAYAAVEFSSFDVLVLPSSVALEWQTASEYDLIGFEVWYKEETQSQSAYQMLGKRIAQGSPRHGVTYRMDVTYALKEGTAYCFQLRELPINGERGEILNRCGYGLGISAEPTPTPTDLSTPTSTVTPTLMVTLTTPLTGTVDPFSTTSASTTNSVTTTLPTTGTFPVLPPGPVQPEEEGEGASFVLPTADSFTQGETPTPFSDAQGGVVTPGPDLQGTSPLPTPVTPLTMTGPVTMAAGAPDPPVMSASTGLLSQTADLTTTVAPSAVTGVESPLPTPPPPPPSAGVANSPYIVLTATPTPEAIAPAPTFTPYPTGVPQAEVNLLGVRVPNTQNLMIMLLCGVFSGASGLGILGLLSTLLYMRSRAARQERSAQRRFQ